MSKNIVFVSKCLCFICLLIIADFVAGAVLNKLFYKQKSGKFFTTSHALKDGAEDIVIFGNSHAAQHFNAPIMKKELHASVFNFGNQGQSLLYVYPVVKSILDRYKPKLVIINVDYTELQYNSDDYQRLSILLPYYTLNAHVDSAIEMIDVKEQYKALSSSYRYNSIIGYSLLNTFKPTLNKSYISLGYDPVYGDICANLQQEGNIVVQTPDQKVRFDHHKIKELTDLISAIQKQGVSLLITTTPLYNDDVKKKNPYALKMASILKGAHVDYLNDGHNPDFAGNCKLFSDLTHLNDTGATEWTNRVIQYIKQKRFF